MRINNSLNPNLQPLPQALHNLFQSHHFNSNGLINSRSGSSIKSDVFRVTSVILLVIAEAAITASGNLIFLILFNWIALSAIAFVNGRILA